MGDAEGFPKPNTILPLQEGTEAKRLPEELDKPGTLFAYGYLLIHEKVRDLLPERGPNFPILEAENIEDARQKAADPNAIVILRNVVLEGVRVDEFSEQMMRNWLQDEKGLDEIQRLIREGILSHMSVHGGLYARVSKDSKDFLNGGLVIGLKPEELPRFDGFEMEPIYKRTLVPELEIEDQKYAPLHIQFYAGDDKYEPDEYEWMRMDHLKENRGSLKYSDSVRKRPERRKPKIDQ